MHRFIYIILVFFWGTGDIFPSDKLYPFKNSAQISQQRPLHESHVHDLGTLWSSVTNFGQFGEPSYLSPSMEWPGGTGCFYLHFGGLWIGAIAGSDTIVTQTDLGLYEWSPSENYFYEYGPGKSTLDSYVVYDDLLQEQPLGIRVFQRVLSWLDPDFDDFVAYEFDIIHAGDKKLDGLYVGWMYDYDIGAGIDPVFPGNDDLVDYDGWHSTEYENWHTLPPNLINDRGNYIDIVENIDLNGNGILDGYDTYGVPWGDPYNPRYDSLKISPDGYPDEWQVFITLTGDTLLIPRNISFMYDGDDPSSEPLDTGEIGALPVDATGFAGGRLLYSDIRAYGATIDDFNIRPVAHQWWPADADPRTDADKYMRLSGHYPLTAAFMRHPFDSGMPVNDYRVLQSSGPFYDFMPGDTLRFVWVEAVGKGLSGLRRNMDQATIAYYSGSLFSNPAFPGSPVDDVHWAITFPPVFGESFVKPAFVPPGFGHITVAAQVYDENGDVTGVDAEIVFNTVPVDTLPLYDDGTHYDTVAGDSLYVNQWPVPANQEGIYHIHILAEDNDGDRSKKKNAGTFTTIGPVVIRHIIFPETDPVPSPGDELELKISLRNNGRTVRAETVRAELSTSDSLACLTGNQTVQLTQFLLPSAEILAQQPVTLKISQKASHNHRIPIYAKIFSGNNLFWHDTTFITVVDDVPPQLVEIHVPRVVSDGETVPVSARFFDQAGVKSATVYIQTPQDSTVSTLKLAHNIDDSFIAEFFPSFVEPADFDMDMVFQDYLGNADTAKNIAGFTTRKFNVQNSILLIDDDGYNSPDFSSSKTPYNLYYQQALDSLGLRYDLYSVYFFGKPDSALMDAYRLGVVIWETGDTRLSVTENVKLNHRDELALSDEERKVIIGFLRKGGRLFLSGQGIGYQFELYEDFYKDYLGCSVTQKNVASRRVQRTGHIISAGFPDVVNVRGGSGANNQMYPSGVQTESATCFPIFNYTLGEGRAAVAFENNGSRVVYFGCGFEAFADKDIRVTLMKRIVDYLLQDVGISQELKDNGPNCFALYQNYPNPFNASTRIDYELPVRAPINISVYNVLGQTIDILVDEVKKPGRYSVVWHTDSQADGIYFLKMVSGNYTQSVKLLLLR
ncbi:T9SS type A sorting domain-containing protein [candidate division KSB1 bacterium]|nr:T9SS type A sorting domain-containing protein [candidate division KSB1 bacterium]